MKNNHIINLLYTNKKFLKYRNEFDKFNKFEDIIFHLYFEVSTPESKKTVGDIFKFLNKNNKPIISEYNSFDDCENNAILNLNQLYQLKDIWKRRERSSVIFDNESNAILKSVKKKQW